MMLTETTSILLLTFNRNLKRRKLFSEGEGTVTDPKQKEIQAEKKLEKKNKREWARLSMWQCRSSC